MPTPEEFAEAQRARFVEELSDLLRIPSISTLPAHRENMQRAARWIADRPRRTGLDAEIIAAQPHPVGYAEWVGAPGRPMHSPDEKLDLVHFHNGIHAVMRFWERMATT